MRIKIEMRDGTVKEFPDERRPGGSYRNKIRNEKDFIVITSVWDEETWIPTTAIKQIETYEG